MRPPNCRNLFQENSGGCEKQHQIAVLTELQTQIEASLRWQSCKRGPAPLRRRDGFLQAPTGPDSCNKRSQTPLYVVFVTLYQEPAFAVVKPFTGVIHATHESLQCGRLSTRSPLSPRYIAPTYMSDLHSAKEPLQDTFFPRKRLCIEPR